MMLLQAEVPAVITAYYYYYYHTDCIILAHYAVRSLISGKISFVKLHWC